LIALGPRGWWRLAEAQAAVFRAHAQVRLRPLGALVADSASSAVSGNVERGAAAPRQPAAPPGLSDLALARALEQAVSRVSRLGLTRPLCLARSLALVDLLRRHGIDDAAVCVGVRMIDRSLRAHAWVEWRGVVLGDSVESVRTYTPIRDLAVLAHGATFLGARAA
jgi:hypothetical protein